GHLDPGFLARHHAPPAALPRRRAPAVERLRSLRGEPGREPAAPGAARRHAGGEPRRRPRPADAGGGARHGAPELRAVRARQGPGRARRALPPRAAQRGHPGAHRARAAGRLHAGRGHRGRDDLHVAGHRADDPRRRPRAQLPGGAEHGAGDRRAVHAGEPGHRHPLRDRRPAGAAAVRRPRWWWPAGPRGVALGGLAIVPALVLVALVAPALVPGSPTEIATGKALHGPSLAEPFGMDDLGRSVLSRVAHAYRVSLAVALGSVALALAVGGPLGLVAGYAEGAADQLIMRPLDVLMAFPAILLALALMTVFRP